jgi:hypothetical protein
MIVMLRVDNGGRATAVVNSHYPKKLISILRLDYVAGARTCLPRGRLSAIKAAKLRATSCSGDSRRDPPRCLLGRVADVHCWLATLISSSKSALFLPNAGVVFQVEDVLCLEAS